MSGMSHPPTERSRRQTVRIFLCGDVMTGRGIDQVLEHPCSPELYEDFVRFAGDYVRLAEEANGPIPRHNEPALGRGAGRVRPAQARCSHHQSRNGRDAQR